MPDTDFPITPPTLDDSAAAPEELSCAAACPGPANEVAAPPVPPAAPEPCPTPLAWQQVLAAFREEATPWEIRNEGRMIRGRTWGNGPPLYFLLGMGGTYEAFCLTAWLLRTDYRCVLFDHASGRRPRGKAAGASYAGDLFTVADHFGDRQFPLFATSFGTLVALQAALSQPQRIERMILQGGFACRQLSMVERGLIRLCSLLPIRLGHLPGRSFIQRQNHLPWFPPYDTTRWQFFLQDAGQVAGQEMCRRAGVIRDTDLRSQLPEIRQPVLLIRGEGDGLIAAHCHEDLAAGLPHARSEWMHSTGHIPYLTHPHRLVKLIKPFLAEGT